MKRICFFLLFIISLPVFGQSCIYSWQAGTVVNRTEAVLPGGVVQTTLWLLASGLGSDSETCITSPGSCKILICASDAAKKGVPCEDVVLPSCVNEQIAQCPPDFLPYIRKVVVNSSGAACP